MNAGTEATVPEEWKLMADAVPGLLAYLDGEGRLIMTNRRCREWLGCDGEGLRGRPIQEFLGAGGALMGPHLAAAATGRDCVFDAELPTPAGVRTARISLVPHLDPPRGPRGYVAMMLDVLDKQTASELRRTAEEMAGICKTARASLESGLGLLEARHPAAAGLREALRSLERGTALSKDLGRPQGPVPARPEAPSGKAVVLLAEDESAVRRLVSRVLANAGYHVIESASGAEALEKAAACPGVIDLLLTDVLMAGMNGRELSQRLRSVRPETQVLFMSGCPDDSALLSMRFEGLCFIAKPFTPAALVAKVREVLSVAGRSV